MKANLYPGRGSWPDWNDPEILQRDQLPAHAYMIPFPDLASCRHAITENRRYASPYVLMLNNGWEYRRYPNILQMPENILSFRSGFDPVAVPSNNPPPDASESPAIPAAGYPFPIVPPLIPQEQPVLVYRRTCRLPLFWGGLRKHLVLQGISAACHVFLNGRPVGYAQGTGLPASFDVTAVLHDGDNELFVLTYPDCSASYLENTAARPWPGLIRDAYFEAVPPIYLHDLQLATRPAAGQDADVWQLELRLSVLSYRISLDSPQIRLLLCKDQEIVSDSNWPVSLKPADPLRHPSPAQTTGELAVSLQIAGIQAWSDENPALYDLYIDIEERGSRELVCVHQLVGFRQIGCRNRRLLINGQPVQLKAVAWPARTASQDGSPDSRALAGELRQIRQNHFNALYIRDFPADPILLELCDIFGLYIIDEAPVGARHELVDRLVQADPVWRAAALDRLERLIRRDINHPCVVLWSADYFRTNAPGAGFLAEHARKLDSTRFLHLIDTDDVSRDLDRQSADLVWPGHAATGGCGRCYCTWSATPPAALREFRQMLKPLTVRAVDAAAGAFVFTNLMHWTSANYFTIGWLLLRNGKVMLSGALDSVRAGPGEDTYVDLWYGDQSFGDGADYLLRFEMAYAGDCLWAEEGTASFSCEFSLVQAALEPPAPQRAGGRLRLESDRHHLIVSGSRFWLVFNQVSGTLESWRVGDKELIAANNGLAALPSRQPDFFDGKLGEVWRKAGYDRLQPFVLSVQQGCDGQSAVVEMVMQLAAPGRPAVFEWISRYEIYASGEMRLFASMTPLGEGLPPPPCFGFSLLARGEYSGIGWYGRGPAPGFYRLHQGCGSGLFQHNSPNERNDGRSDGQIGAVQQVPADIYSDVRWLSLRDQNGFGLQVRSDRPFAFAVGPDPAGYPFNALFNGRQENRPLLVRLFSQTAETSAAQPLKAVWYFSPVVFDASRGADRRD